MSISTTPNRLGEGPLDLKDMANVLMHDALVHMRQLRTVVNCGGVLALEAEMGVDGLGHRLRSLVHDDAPGDRVTNLTCLALRYAADKTLDNLMPDFAENSEDVSTLMHARKYVVGNGVIGISGDMGNMRNVIKPVFTREQGKPPTTNEHTAIAKNSFGMLRRLAGRNRYLSVPVMKHLRRYPELKQSHYNPDRFTLTETDSGLALAFAKPEAVRALTLGALSETPAIREVVKPTINAHCLGLGADDSRGNLVEATWELMTDTFVANAETSQADRFRRDMVLATSWAVTRLHS